MSEAVDLSGVSAEKYAAAARLKQARAAKYSSARHFALSWGFNPTTVAHHENGQRELRKKQAAEYARPLRVTPEWLLFGVSNYPHGTHGGTSKVVGLAPSNSQATLADDREVAGKLVAHPPIADDYDVLIVPDASLEPFAYEGSHLHFRPMQPLAKYKRSDLDRRFCIVLTEDGKRDIAKVIVQSTERASLLSWDDKVLAMGVKISLIAPIVWVNLIPTL